MIDVKKLGELMWREDAASRALAANQNGDTVALFRGKSATVKGNWLMKDG